MAFTKDLIECQGSERLLIRLIIQTDFASLFMLPYIYFFKSVFWLCFFQSYLYFLKWGS